MRKEIPIPDRSAWPTDAQTLSTPGSPNADDGERRTRRSADEDELPAGRLIAGRFRIVGRLGSGGMGDVYRADDLVLGTSVALKFLPPGLATDPVRLERLRTEVRVARQVAHPNVCRVYDIGDADGRPFLSMEYIDGEDLSSLLRRIGRLPKDKAVELAREICAGIAAAHELGVIHRDLKPANVMIDGRGRARVADFGLASAMDEPCGGRDAMAGTPAYMSPEQLGGTGATKSSDIYALGLVLYELFTGKRAHDATTLAGLKEKLSSSTPPTSPSELIDGMDAGAERVIMHCLEPDPEDRPVSALAVMAALPGGDPLAAMLKAGEMPSPELVAASGRPGTLSTRRALQLAAMVLVGTVVTIWAAGSPPFGEVVGGILPPEVLEHRADALLRDFGYESEKTDSAWGFDLDWGIADLLSSASTEERLMLIRSETRPVLRYWYRTSPSPMNPWHGSVPGTIIGSMVTPDDPPLSEVGGALVRLGPRGALLELKTVPDSHRPTTDRDTEELALRIMRAAGIDPSSVEQVEWSGSLPMPGSSTVAWRVDDRRPGGVPRIVVATLTGDSASWIRIDPPPEPRRPGDTLASHDYLSLIFFGFFVGGAFVATLNIRSGRWDRRGATRLAAAAFVLCFASNLIGSHHSLSASQEVRLFFTSVAYAATRGLMTWLLYIAIEPFIRRLHPSSLISWSRLLAGRLSDPAVGRDVLIGLAASGLTGACLALWGLAWDLSESIVPFWTFAGGETPLDTADFIAIVLRQPVVVLGSNLGFLLVYVVARWLLGRFRALAPIFLWAAVFLFWIGAYTSGLDSLLLIVFAAVGASGSTYLAVRHGLLAFAVYSAFSQTLLFTIVTLDPTDWYFAPTAIFVALVVGLTVFGVRVAADRSAVSSIR